jgi:hypothetical protein
MLPLIAAAHFKLAGRHAPGSDEGATIRAVLAADVCVVAHRDPAVLVDEFNAGLCNLIRDPELMSKRGTHTKWLPLVSRMSDVYT